MDKRKEIQAEQEQIIVQKQEKDNLHDKGYKRIFSIKKNFLDFIKKYIGMNWMLELTENDLELINKEFITDQFDTYESDLVYKVNTKEGSAYLFFLFEFQSYNDFSMPFRLLVYMTAICWIILRIVTKQHKEENHFGFQRLFQLYYTTESSVGQHHIVLNK